jgi:hypothetical protein
VTAVAENTAVSTIGGRFPNQWQLAADAALFTRIQYEAVAVMVAAFAVAVVFDPDEPVPFFLSLAGEAVPCPREPDEP